MQKSLTKKMRSNCLLSVLALKLRHWRTVKIMHRSAFANWRLYGVFCPHFYAIHKGCEYHFHTDETLRFPQYFGLFDGNIRIIQV